MLLRITMGTRVHPLQKGELVLNDSFPLDWGNEKRRNEEDLLSPKITFPSTSRTVAITTRQLSLHQQQKPHQRHASSSYQTHHSQIYMLRFPQISAHKLHAAFKMKECTFLLIVSMMISSSVFSTNAYTFPFNFPV